MSNLNEPNGASSNASQPDDVVSRVRDLERENANLKADLASLHARHIVDGGHLASLISDLPQNEVEYRELLAQSRRLSDLLREMEAKFGLESPQ